MRGIKGIKVTECEVTPLGVKKDRNWVIICKKKMKPVANHNNSIITFLRQLNKKNTPNELKLVLQDTECFPDLKKRNHTLYFDQDYSKAEFVNANKSYRGYKESDEVCEWLSEIFEEPVVLLRAEKERMMECDKARLPYAKETDRRGQFLTDGACHLINN